MAPSQPSPEPQDDLPLLSFGNVLLRARRVIAALTITGALMGLLSGLLSERRYLSYATFIPQGTEQGGGSGLAVAASQFGIRMPSSGGTWTPPVYVQLLRSRALLEPIALDTVIVAEEGGRRVAIMDLLNIPRTSPARRLELTIDKSNSTITPIEVKSLNAVKLSVLTSWPSVSLAIAQHLLRRVNEFNLETRKSQAKAERQFAEAQVDDAERALREAEDRLQAFMQANRAVTNSPELSFQRERLQRNVTLRQQLYTSLLQNREEARIREVRDTPVITVLEEPQLPVGGEARRSVQKGMLGALGGLLLGLAFAILSEWLERTRRAPSPEAREFFRLLSDATPRFLRPRRS